MSVAIRSAFWTLVFGSLGWSLFKLVKPDDELLKKVIIIEFCVCLL